MSEQTSGSTLNPETEAGAAGSPKPVGYCRSCGKALDESTVRQAEGSIYCADHVPASTRRTGFAEPRYSESPYSSATPPVRPQPDYNPAAAFWLGLIPGVGAMYNVQYAKGLIHVFTFGLLISLADQGGPFEAIFGLMIPAFIFYMAFEAHDTARKRRDGQPVDEFSSLIAGPEANRYPIAPVVLIVFGIFFLLDSLEILQLRNLMKFWPVTMIALGGYMLYARTAGQRRPVDFGPAASSSAPLDAPIAKVGAAREANSSDSTPSGNSEPGGTR